MQEAADAEEQDVAHQHRGDLAIITIQQNQINRELTNKNKHVFKRTHVCLCAYLCAVSISVFKSVFFCHINIWFG